MEGAPPPPPGGGGGAPPPPGGFAHQGGCSCCADAFVDDGEFGSEDLNTYIVRCTPSRSQRSARDAPRLQVSESIRCLNESREGAAKTMFAKGWCHKLNEDPFLESDAVRSPTPSPRAGLLGWLSRIGLGARRTSS